MSKKFKIENLDENQAIILWKALDLYSRLMMGQVEELTIFFRDHCSHENEATFQQIEDAVKKLKSTIFPGMRINGSYAIVNELVPDESKIAYDMLKVIRHRLAWEKYPNGGITVDFDPLTMKCGSIPFIEMKVDEKHIK